jgi:type I restriction enzyme, S subunit
MISNKFIKIEDCIKELPKSNILASHGNNFGRYKLYLSGKIHSRIDHANNHEDCIIMGDGGEATIFYSKGKCSYSSHNFAFKSKNEQIRDKYLYRYIENILTEINYLGFVGSGLKNIDKKFFNKIKIQILPKSEQLNIETTLDTFDDMIENYELQINKYKKLRQSLLNDLMTKGINHSKFKQFNYKKIPSDWRIGKFKNFITLQRGFDLPKHKRIDGDVPIFGSNGIVGFHNKFTNNNFGVVTGRSGSIGKIYFIEKPHWCLNTTLFVKNFHKNYERFVYYYLLFFNLKRYSSGTGVPTLNRNDVHAEEICFPEINEQIEISKILSSIDEIIQNRIEKKNKIKNLKFSIMSALIKKNIRII